MAILKLEITSKGDHLEDFLILLQIITKLNFNIQIKNNTIIIKEEDYEDGNTYLPYYFTKIIEYCIVKCSKFIDTKNLQYLLYLIKCKECKNKLDVIKSIDLKKSLDHMYSNNLPLIIASKNGELDIVKYLVSKNADVRAEKNQAMFIACEFNHLDVVKYLVEQGVDVRAEKNQAMSLACLNGYIGIVKYLVEQGADIDQENLNKYIIDSSLSLNILKYLVSLGADLTFGYDNILLITIDNNEFEIIRYIISNMDKYWCINEYILDMLLYRINDDKEQLDIINLLIVRCFNCNLCDQIRTIASKENYQNVIEYMNKHYKDNSRKRKYVSS